MRLCEASVCSEESWWRLGAGSAALLSLWEFLMTRFLSLSDNVAHQSSINGTVVVSWWSGAGSTGRRGTWLLNTASQFFVTIAMNRSDRGGSGFLANNVAQTSMQVGDILLVIHCVRAGEQAWLKNRLSAAVAKLRTGPGLDSISPPSSRRRNIQYSESRGRDCAR
jgi:hypothetical protein